jgi:hypothetical protein
VSELAQDSTRLPVRWAAAACYHGVPFDFISMLPRSCSLSFSSDCVFS